MIYATNAGKQINSVRDQGALRAGIKGQGNQGPELNADTKIRNPTLRLSVYGT